METFSTRQIRMAIGVFVFFCMSAFMSCREISYSIWGQTADAQITDRGLVEVRNRRSTTTKMRLAYRFTDADGMKREGYLLFDPEGEIPDGITLPVQYLAGKDGPSRLAGRPEWTWPILFVGSIVVAIVWAVTTVRKATSGARRGRNGNWR